MDKSNQPEERIDSEQYSSPDRDPSRKLLMIPDPTHAVKCFASAIRRSNIIIPAEFVEKYHLSSNKATVQDVQKLLKLQESSDYKPGKRLSSIVLHPDHFDTMNVKIAKELWSEEPTTCLDYMNVNNNTKENPTSFILKSLTDGLR